MKAYKSVVEVGGRKNLLVTINHEREAESKETKSVDSLHHIHLLDRSYSMSGELNGLIENVKKTVKAMSDRDYISVVWFSSHNECKTLIKGARKDEESINALLETIKYPVGSTCFSTPLTEVNQIIDDLKVICPNFSVTLFTDGEPVTPWGDNEEIDKIFAQLSIMKDRVIAVNTIGYGNYYNEKLLKAISDESMYGTMIHSSKIDDYLEIFSHNYEKISELVFDSVELFVPKAVASEEAPPYTVLYLSNKATKIEDSKIDLSMLSRIKNQFFILAPDDEDFQFSYNGELYETSEITSKVPKPTLKNFYYSLAYELFYRGERRMALDILSKNAQDKHFVDRQINVFSKDEVSEYSEDLRKAIFNNKERYKDGECPEEYLPKDDAVCVMDILGTLASGNSYYIPTKNYNRIGRKVTDGFNLFESSGETVYAPFNEFTFNKKHLNLSIKFRIDGTVKLNPKAAKDNDLDPVIDSHIYRNHTIIKDGNLNMEKIEVAVSDATYRVLDALNPCPIEEVREGREVIEGEEHTVVSLYLGAFPIVNRMYLDAADNTSEVLKVTKNVIELEAKQKVLNYFLSKIKSGSTPAMKDSKYKDFTVKQIEVLSQHGLNKDLSYVGVDNQISAKSETDYYESRVLEFGLKGFSSLPSVNAVFKKFIDGKKMNGPETLMHEYSKELVETMKAEKLDPEADNVANRNFFQMILGETKKKLNEERVKQSSIKIAKVLNGDWFKGTEMDSKGNYTYTEGKDTLVIKTGYVKVHF
jgi:hypothetical protein